MIKKMTIYTIAASLLFFSGSPNLCMEPEDDPKQELQERIEEHLSTRSTPRRALPGEAQALAMHLVAGSFWVILALGYYLCSSSCMHSPTCHSQRGEGANFDYDMSRFGLVVGIIYFLYAPLNIIVRAASGRYIPQNILQPFKNRRTRRLLFEALNGNEQTQVRLAIEENNKEKACRILGLEYPKEAVLLDEYHGFLPSVDPDAHATDIEAGEAGEACTEPFLKLQSSDGVVFEIPRHLANYSQVLRNMIEDCRDTSSADAPGPASLSANEPIPLPNVNEEILWLVVQSLRIMGNTEEGQLKRNLRPLFQSIEQSGQTNQYLAALDYMGIEELKMRALKYFRNQLQQAAGASL